MDATYDGNALAGPLSEVFTAEVSLDTVADLVRLAQKAGISG